jgi:uncharacterized protein YcfL
MKKYALLLTVALITVALPACRKKQTCCPCPEQEVVVQKEKRVSGPLSERSVQWDKEDYK